jgi:hypothetical protein
MVRVVRPVAAEEIAALVREGLRLMALGSAAGDAELQAYRFRKIDILERVAAHPGPYTDEVERAEVARLASRMALQLRSAEERMFPTILGGRSCL